MEVKIDVPEGWHITSTNDRLSVCLWHKYNTWYDSNLGHRFIHIYNFFFIWLLMSVVRT
jgi:hypothetical protein